MRSSGLVVFEAPGEVDLDGIEDELTRAFELMRAAVDRGDAVVVCLDERDVQGAGDVPSAALAHGLLGLIRAFAVEGRRDGWRVAALSCPHGTDRAEREAWIARLAESPASSGALVRLGGEPLGRGPT